MVDDPPSEIERAVRPRQVQNIGFNALPHASARAVPDSMTMLACTADAGGCPDGCWGISPTPRCDKRWGTAGVLGSGGRLGAAREVAVGGPGIAAGAVHRGRMAEESSRFVVYGAVACNAAIAVSKFVAA